MQQNKIFLVTKKNCEKKCMEKFVEISKKSDDYKKFYKQFGGRLKPGIHEDYTNRTKIAEMKSFKTL